MSAENWQKNKQQSNRTTSNRQQATKAPGEDIAARLVRLGAAVVAIAGSLPRTRAGRHIEDQLLRSGTAAGAHYGEARAAESRADFVHKLRLGAKELREAGYWLQLIQFSGLSHRCELASIIDEIDQLVAILIASSRTALCR
jgi:four helix bundle protein